MKRDFSQYKTLFLDRDGTINVRIVDGYVQLWEEFKFLPGSLEAIHHFSDFFDRIVVVTNQQCIGKELVRKEEIDEIHRRMCEEIEYAHGRIDQIYVCPHLAAFNPLCRKPNPGMALQAKEDFPEIDFSKSIMIGDTDSDLLFGSQLGMLTVGIKNKNEKWHEIPDISVTSLYEFYEMLY